MGHRYKTSSFTGEWYDEYKCQDCDKTAVYNAEDLMTLEKLIELDTTVCPNAPPPAPEEAPALVVADWKPIRDALAFAYAELGLVMEPEGHSGKRYKPLHWNLSVKLHEYNTRNLGKCLECKTDLNFYTVIRCLDCKACLCEHCAPQHFGSGHSTRANRSHAPGDLLGKGQRSE